MMNTDAPILPSLDEKATYVERMFARIAPGYDRMNRLMTFNQDQRWRARAVELIAPPACGRALDVGCGTGDFLPLLADWMPDGLAVGVDYTLPMMQAGRNKIAGLGRRAAFVGGDALRLPFADATFDAITTGFMMRNVVDIVAAFREMWRVGREGCVLACLEVSRPRQALLRLGHALYTRWGTPLLARVVGADLAAYRYLPASMRTFPDADGLADMIRQAGWHDVSYRQLGAGAVAIHVAHKRTATAPRERR